MLGRLHDVLEDMPESSRHVSGEEVMGKVRTSTVLIAIASVGLVFASFEIAQRVIVGARPSNRLVIYAIQLSLRAGMSVKDVTHVVETHRTKDIKVWWSDSKDALNVATSVGLNEHCELRVKFRGGALVSSSGRGDDVPDQRFADAPPDIGP